MSLDWGHVDGIAGKILSMQEAGQERRHTLGRRKTIAQAGQMAAGGDTQGASAAIMQTGELGDLQAGIGMRHDEADRKFAIEDRKRADNDRDMKKASSQLFADATKDGTEEGWRNAASKAFELGDEEAGKGAYSEYTRMKEIREGEEKARDIRGAQSMVDMYQMMDRKERRTMIDGILEDPKVMKEVEEKHPRAWAMINDDDPTNDDEAILMWAVDKGASVEGLKREIEQERKDRDDKALEEMKHRHKLAEEAAKNGNENALGSPFSPRYAGRVPDAVLSKVYADDAEILSDARDARASGKSLMSQVDRFEAVLNREGITEGLMGPRIWDDIAQFANKEVVQELQGIMEIMVTEMKKEGSGVFTDDDARRMAKAVMNPNKSLKANLQFASDMRAVGKRLREHEQFLVRYQAQHGIGELPYALAIWEEYADAVPLFNEQGSTAGHRPNIYTWMKENESAAVVNAFNDTLTPMSDDEWEAEGAQFGQEPAPEADPEPAPQPAPQGGGGGNDKKTPLRFH